MKFNKFALSELATIKYGKNQKKVLSESGNIPIFGTGGLMGYATTALYDKPSVLIGRKGTIGKVKYVEQPFWTVDTLFYTIINTNLVIPKYLFYVMSLIDLNNYNEGTTIPSLRTETLNRLEFDIPDLEEQRKILSCLNPIDEKIELNNAINNNLEQQAQAIFKSWFIDFEPFSNRKPNDWSISTLGNVSIMGAGGDKPQNVSQIKTDLYEYPIYSNGLSDEGLYGFTDKPKISEESVTVSARGTIGFVCLRHIPYVPIVRLVTLIPKTEIISAKYLYLWLKQLHITGTGTTQQQLTVPYFQKTEILVPSQEIVTLFTATVEPIFEKIWANQNENEKLSSLRDTLLPKLMSGELDVSDIEI